MLYEEDLRNQQQENAEERKETDVRETKARSGKKKGIGKRILAITLSAALFGTVTAAAFQGVTYAAKKLQGQEDTTAAKLQIPSRTQTPLPIRSWIPLRCRRTMQTTASRWMSAAWRRPLCRPWFPSPMFPCRRYGII